MQPNVTVEDVAEIMSAEVRDCEDQRFPGYVEYVRYDIIVGFVPRDPQRRRMFIYGSGPDAELVAR